MSSLFAENFEAERKKLAEAYERITALEQDSRRLSELLSGEKQAVMGLEKKLADSEAEAEGYRGQLDDLRRKTERMTRLETEWEEMRADRKQADELAVAYLKKLDKLTAAHETLKELAASQDAMIKNLDGKIDPLNAMVEALKTRRDADGVIAESLAHL